MSLSSNTFKKHTKTFLFFTILLLAIVFIIIGLAKGGFHDTMGKAVRICLECIGIG